LHPLSKILDDLSETVVPNSAILVTADVESLYPSIPTPEGINIVMKYIYSNLHKKFEGLTIPPHLREALLLVLTNNYVEFNGTFYLQKSGTAMGTPVAVCYASLFLAALEETLLENIRINLYRRFIDDIFLIWIGSRTELDEFNTQLNNLHPNINLTFEISTSEVNFLDLTIYKGENMVNNLLDTKSYQKPFNNFLYIPASSFHPTHQKVAFIKGLLKSYLKANSNQKTYYDIRNKFFWRLRKRGYSRKQLLTIFKAAHYDKNLRHTLLHQRVEKEQYSFPITLKIQDSPSVEQLGIKQFLETARKELAPLSAFIPEIRLCLTSAKSIGNTLVRTQLTPSKFPLGQPKR
jgi:hypothetical protein